MSYKCFYEISEIKDPYIFHIGDVLSIHLNVKEGTKERIQIFQGICIAKKGKGIEKTFTIRRTDFKGRIERIFPLFMPSIEKIVIKQKSRVRRAKLYYLRNLFGKKARLKKLYN